MRSQSNNCFFLTDFVTELRDVDRGHDCISSDLIEPIALPIEVLGQNCKLGISDRSSICNQVKKFLEAVYGACRDERPAGIKKEQRMNKKCQKYDKKVTKFLG